MVLRLALVLLVALLWFVDSYYCCYHYPPPGETRDEINFEEIEYFYEAEGACGDLAEIEGARTLAHSRTRTLARSHARSFACPRARAPRKSLRASLRSSDDESYHNHVGAVIFARILTFCISGSLKGLD